MGESYCIPPAKNLSSSDEELKLLTDYVEEKIRLCGCLEILEAGCGRKWPIELDRAKYKLTGIDLDAKALELRKCGRKDLDIAIVGDLRSIKLPPNAFDLIFSSNVLEHIDGAEEVLTNLVRWLKPGGSMVLIFPNRDCAYSFVTRMTPFWLHVWYKRYIQKVKNAGKPGFDPYPVHFDSVVSRKGFRRFCHNANLALVSEYRIDRPPMNRPFVWSVIEGLLRIIWFFSFGRFSVTHRNLLFIVEKPAEIESDQFSADCRGKAAALRPVSQRGNMFERC